MSETTRRGPALGTYRGSGRRGPTKGQLTMPNGQMHSRNMPFPSADPDLGDHPGNSY